MQWHTRFEDIVEPKIMSIYKSIDYLGISESEIRALIKRGVLEKITWSKDPDATIYIPVADLDRVRKEYMNERNAKSDARETM